MKAMTVKDLLEAKGKRPIAFVQVTREEEANDFCLFFGSVNNRFSDAVAALR